MVTALFALQDYNLRVPIILSTAERGGDAGETRESFLYTKMSLH